MINCNSLLTETTDLNSCINLYNNCDSAMKKILHYPQLDTVLMVEKFLEKNSGEFKKRALWESLPKKMMYQTFCVIFDYLLKSGKIAVDAERKVGWIWDPEGVRHYLKKKNLAWN